MEIESIEMKSSPSVNKNLWGFQGKLALLLFLASLLVTLPLAAENIGYWWDNEAKKTNGPS